MFEVTFRDSSPASLLARWFHGERYADSLVPDARVALFGKVELDRSSGNCLMVQPEVEMLSSDDEADETLHPGRSSLSMKPPIKSQPAFFAARRIASCVRVRCRTTRCPIAFARHNLPSLAEALEQIHNPATRCRSASVERFCTPAQTRLIFDEFFWLECGLALKKNKARIASGISFAITDQSREQIKKMLPFKPTGAQRRVMQEIADDMKRPHPMNRLLQGDVGSGKTIVAAEAAVIAIENGYQVAVLAPTEILAAQHFAYFKRLLEKLGFVVVLLTGSAGAREKQQIKKLIAEGLVHVAVGTHALLQEDVKFSKLGLAVVDEQHRFGVMQRLELMKKGEQPDVLVMTATPIPRTLALTIYGDLDVSSIDEMPPGRKPIITKHVPEVNVEGVYSFVAQQIKAGRSFCGLPRCRGKRN